jgi:hypothetical protein
MGRGTAGRRSVMASTHGARHLRLARRRRGFAPCLDRSFPRRQPPPPVDSPRGDPRGDRRTHDWNRRSHEHRVACTPEAGTSAPHRQALRDARYPPRSSLAPTADAVPAVGKPVRVSGCGRLSVGNTHGSLSGERRFRWSQLCRLWTVYPSRELRRFESFTCHRVRERASDQRKRRSEAFPIYPVGVFKTQCVSRS